MLDLFTKSERCKYYWFKKAVTQAWSRGHTRSKQSFFFSIRRLSVLHGHSVFSSPPQRSMTSDFEWFSIPDFIHYIYFHILILEKEPVFSLLLNKGTTGTIFITSLVWHGPWLGIGPGTSRTRSHHYTIRLSKRRCLPSY